MIANGPAPADADNDHTSKDGTSGVAGRYEPPTGLQRMTDDGVCVVTVTCHTDHDVAFDAIVDELSDVIDAGRRQGVRAIVLDAADGCLLPDQPALDSEVTVSERRSQAGACADLAAALEVAPFPIIAAVSGQVSGRSLEVLLAVDLIVASVDSRFVFDHLTRGTVPEMGTTFRLPQRVGTGSARRLLLGGETLTASEAAAAGLIDLTVAEDQRTAAAVDLAHRIAHASPRAIAVVKQLMRTTPTTTAAVAAVAEREAVAVTASRRPATTTIATTAAAPSREGSTR